MRILWLSNEHVSRTSGRQWLGSEITAIRVGKGRPTNHNRPIPRISSSDQKILFGAFLHNLPSHTYVITFTPLSAPAIQMLIVIIPQNIN